MKNIQLRKILESFPDESEIRFCVFSNMLLQRCDVKENDVMIKKSNADNNVMIMLNTNQMWDDCVIDKIKTQNGQK